MALFDSLHALCTQPPVQPHLPEFSAPPALDLLPEGVEDPTALKAIFILGSGGSGKGTVSKGLFAGEGLKYINQDQHLERLLTDEGIPLKDAGMDYGLFKKAQDISRRERNAYAHQRLGLHIEMTGWDYSRIEKPVNALRALGYDCYAAIVRTRLKTALTRNWKRGLEGGRLVPKGYIRKANQGVEENLGRYVQLFGAKNTLIVNNDGAVDADTWKHSVAPVLAAKGKAMLARPIQNPIGKAWLAEQRAAKQRDESTHVEIKLSATLQEALLCR